MKWLGPLNTRGAMIAYIYWALSNPNKGDNKIYKNFLLVLSSCDK